MMVLSYNEFSNADPVPTGLIREVEGFVVWMSGTHVSTRGRRPERRIPSFFDRSRQIEKNSSLILKSGLGGRCPGRLSDHQIRKDRASGSGGAELPGGVVCLRGEGGDVCGGGGGAGNAAGLGGETFVGSVRGGIGERDDRAGWWLSSGEGSGRDYFG